MPGLKEGHMNKISIVVVLIMLPVSAFSTSFILNEGSSYIHLSKINKSDFLLELNLSSCDYSDKGGIVLPNQFDRYLLRKKPYPQLIIHLAVENAGDYTFDFTEHRTRTDVSSNDQAVSDNQTVMISKPYWLRDIRGLDVIVSPFHSKDGTMIIADNISIQIRDKLVDTETPDIKSKKINPYFSDIYKQHFINFEYRYEDLADFGSMAVICPTTCYDIQVQQFRGLIQPWVDWKNQKGIPTTVYTTNQTGDTYEEIQAFIQYLYDTDPNLTFVQLVGDYAQVPCLVTTMAGNTGGMDAFYTLLEGDDYYPDIIIGRFSAETAAELYTQIKRSIEYEKNPVNSAWLSRAAGVCSDNPPIPGDDGEHNWDHLDNIRTQLLDYGYDQVDRIYANEGASLQDLIDCLNEGRSLINYCGEGYPTHWVNPPFYVSDAENLINTGMLPFIHVVSCWTGQFYNGTCLSEALMRSRDVSAEEARGAIAVYSSAPEQGISPPMEAQDHFVELLINGTKNTIGGLCYNGSCSMIDSYGEAGAYNFLAWNLFGDASLVLRTKPAENINAFLPEDLPAYYANLNVDTGATDIQVCLSKDNVPVVSAFSGADGIAHLYISDYPIPGEQYILTLSGLNRKAIQSNLTCYNYNYGDHAILDMTVQNTNQFIEPETDILKTVKVKNRGQLPAEDVTILLYAGSQGYGIQPVIYEQNLGLILQGEEKEANLSYRINKGIPDLATVNYRILIAPSGGMYELSDVVHAPSIVIDTVKRSPQVNWVNPGDSFSFIYHLRNDGSAVLRDLNGVLTSGSEFLQIAQQSNSNLTIGPGCADSLVFAASVFSGCPAFATVTSNLDLEAANAVGQSWQQWIVSDPVITVESFESHDLQAFPWLYQSGQWSFSNICLDGLYSLCSQPVTADSIWLELRFYAAQAGVARFCYDLYKNSGCNDIWSFSLNHSEPEELETNHDWLRKTLNIVEGQNSLRWLGKRDPANSSFESTFWLDMVSFPPQTVFDNAHLQVNSEQLEITLAPGEILNVPLSLSTADGKYIHYDAILQKAADAADKSGEINLTCNKSTFTPGSEELFLLTLHNVIPQQNIIEISLALPEKVLATQATAFGMTGQTSMPFTGYTGSFSDLIWSSESGSMADSLRAGVRLVADANLSDMDIFYMVTTLDGAGYQENWEGCINLTSSELDKTCVSLTSSEGWIHDQEEAEICITANQNMIETDLQEYKLNIYYNGSQRLSIPVRVEYNSDPGGFYDTMHLSIYPNPVFETATFAYAVPISGVTQMDIYNIRGQKVRNLVNENLDKGYYRSVWKATDDQGDRVGSGIYFCRLRTPDARLKTIKCIVIR
jgi:hypothetical protein